MRALATCAIASLFLMVDSLAPATPLGVEELLSRHAPMDADGLGGFDFRRFGRSSMGQRLLQRVPSVGADLDVPPALQEALPVETLHAAASAFWVRPDSPPEGWILLSGTFDSEAALSALMRWLGPEGQERIQEGIRCVGHRDEEQIVAALAPDLLYLGSPRRLEGVLDVRRNREASAWSGRRRRLVRSGVGPGAIFWGVATLSKGVSLGAGASAEESALFRTVREAGFSLRLGTEGALRVWLVQESQESGAQLLGWLQKTRQILAMLAGTLDESGGLGEALTAISLKDAGDVVTLELRASSRQLEDWVAAEPGAP